MKISEGSSIILSLEESFRTIKSNYGVEISIKSSNINNVGEDLVNLERTYSCTPRKEVILQIKVDIVKKLFTLQYFYFNNSTGVWVNSDPTEKEDIKYLYDSLIREIDEIRRSEKYGTIIDRAIYELSSEFRGSSVIHQDNFYTLIISSMLEITLIPKNDTATVILYIYSIDDKVKTIRSEVNISENNIDRICNDLRVLIINNIF